jgi:uncharacterized protein
MDEQSITNPFGITVFGSAVSRVEPDIASLHFAVSRVEKWPKDSFGAVREVAQTVHQYLHDAGIPDIGSSRVTLFEEYRGYGGERIFEGYRARVIFHVLLHDLDRLEEIIAGVIDVGVNELHGTQYQTSRLKEIRADARRRAISAAREKAELYCSAAGVTLDEVLHIEDANPDQLRGSHESHVSRDPSLDDEDSPRAMNPGSITVGAAVQVSYGIRSV